MFVGVSLVFVGVKVVAIGLVSVGVSWMIVGAYGGTIEAIYVGESVDACIDPTVLAIGVELGIIAVDSIGGVVDPTLFAIVVFGIITNDSYPCDLLFLR